MSHIHDALDEHPRPLYHAGLSDLAFWRELQIQRRVVQAIAALNSALEDTMDESECMGDELRHLYGALRDYGVTERQWDEKREAGRL